MYEKLREGLIELFGEPKKPTYGVTGQRHKLYAFGDQDPTDEDVEEKLAAMERAMENEGYQHWCHLSDRVKGVPEDANEWLIWPAPDTSGW